MKKISLPLLLVFFVPLIHMDYSKSYETLSFIDEMVSKHKFEKSYLVEIFKSAEKREISALISFKGGFICSLGSGRAVIVETQISKEEEEVKLQVTQMVKLPTRNATTAGMGHKV